MIGASNHIELPIATSTGLFRIAPGDVHAAVVRPRIEVPAMLMRVKICLRRQGFSRDFFSRGWTCLRATHRQVRPPAREHDHIQNMC